MHFSLLPATLLVSVAAAQVSTTYSAPASGATACGALPVVDNCLASTQLIANACSPTDYSCLCDKWNVVVVCFDVCPNDSRLTGIKNTAASYCAYAPSITPTPTPTPLASLSSTSHSHSLTGLPSSNRTRVPSSPTRTGTGTSSAPSGSPTGNVGANNVVFGAGSVIIGLAGLVGAFL